MERLYPLYRSRRRGLRRYSQPFKIHSADSVDLCRVHKRTFRKNTKRKPHAARFVHAHHSDWHCAYDCSDMASSADSRHTAWRGFDCAVRFFLCHGFLAHGRSCRQQQQSGVRHGNRNAFIHHADFKGNG